MVADVVVHVSDTLGGSGRETLQEGLRSIPGVIAPRFNPPRDHLLLVAYDPTEVTAQQILAAVQAKVGNAHLVGL